MGDLGSDVLRPGQVIRPRADKNTAADMVERLYGLKVREIVELNSYDDKNFHVICERDFENPWIEGIPSDGFVLKITNSLDSKKTNLIEGQTALLIFLNDNKIKSPLPVKNSKNRYHSLETIGGGPDKYVVRLLTYVPGKLLHHVETSDELLVDVGRFAAAIDERLKKFHHPAYDGHESMWMLKSVPKLRDFVYAVNDDDRRSTAMEIIEKFEEGVIQNLDKLETGMIHGDLNEQNILVDEKGETVLAVLDLGDSQKSCLIFELAIAMCYMIVKAGDIRRGKYVLRGYRRVRKPTEFEMKILKISICARLIQSLVLGAYSHLGDPKNEYLLITQKPGWALLEELWPMDDEEVLRIWECDKP